MQVTIPTPRFPVGTEYRTRGKHPRQCTVTGFRVTFDLSGAIVRKSYTSTHPFLGQQVTAHDIPETTIAIGLVGTLADFPILTH